MCFVAMLFKKCDTNVVVLSEYKIFLIKGLCNTTESDGLNLRWEDALDGLKKLHEILQEGQRKSILRLRKLP